MASQAGPGPWGAHSALRRDAVLYPQRSWHPLAWLPERTISTPATHFADHAPGNEDGIGNNNGSFVNLLFLRDISFGTARIARRYPTPYGVPADPERGEDPWYVLIFTPLFRRRRPAQAGHPSDG